MQEKIGLLVDHAIFKMFNGRLAIAVDVRCSCSAFSSGAVSAVKTSDIMVSIGIKNNRQKM